MPLAYLVSPTEGRADVLRLGRSRVSIESDPLSQLGSVSSEDVQRASSRYVHSRTKPAATRLRAAARAVQGAVGIAVAMVVWEAVRGLGLVDPRDLPSIPAIVSAAISDSSALLGSALATLKVWALGLLIATVGGVGVGVALALMPRVEVITRPLIEFVRPIPSVALIPVALLVLGLGFRMELALIAFASIWPVLFNAKAGVEGVDPRFVETGRILGLGKAARTVRIVIPGALPAIATGICTAASIALVLAITVEMLAGQSGLGAYLQNVRLNGQVAEMWAATMFAGLSGLGMNLAFLQIERRLLGWSSEHRGS